MVVNVVVTNVSKTKNMSHSSGTFALKMLGTVTWAVRATIVVDNNVEVELQTAMKHQTDRIRSGRREESFNSYKRHLVWPMKACQELNSTINSLG